MPDFTATPDSLARGGLDWLLAQGRETDNGLAWPLWPSKPEDHTYSLFHGGAGIITALLEGRHFGDDRYADAALRGARALEASLTDMYGESLYIGRSGAAVVLAGVGRVLDDERSAAAARRAFGLVRDAFDGERWGEDYEMMLGNAGMALAALEVGDEDFAVLAVEPYLRTARASAHGVNWEAFADDERTWHQFGHGTLGIAYGLAAVAEATGRKDLLELAVAGADDVVARNEAGPEGFLVAHSDPRRPESRQERHSYGWCSGTTGNAFAFRMLARATGDPKWTDLVDRCWHTVTTSGLPERVRPGFWDNSGRCCGTAGVLALAGDLVVERGIGTDFGRTLVGDLGERATVDGDLICWANTEYRDDPPELEPRTSWSHGAAGIVRELVRWSRLTSGGDPDYVLPLPDHPVARRSAA